MGMFPWQRAKQVHYEERKPVLNDDDMFRGDISGKMTMEDAEALDDSNKRHMECFLQSIETLPAHHSRK